MTTRRPSQQDRKKLLEQAILRIEKGRAKTGITKLSISGVAREAGVSPALIHNHHPDVAETIRAKLGRAGQAFSPVKNAALLRLEQRNRELRDMVSKQRAQIAMLASRNETLELENRSLTSRIAAGNVSEIGARRSTRANRPGAER